MSEDVRTYRGRSLAEILPQVREDLGDDAVVLRRREGLAGGVGGFFAKAFIEVEARAGGPRLDVRDDEADEAPVAVEPVAAPVAWPAAELPEPAAAAEALTAAAAAVPPGGGSGFARLLADAYAGGFADAPAPTLAGAHDDAFEPMPAGPPAPDVIPLEMERAAMPALAAQENHASRGAAPQAALSESEGGLPRLPPAAAPAPEPPVSRTKAAATAEARLVEAGLSPAFAAEVVAEAVTHGLPFATPRSLRRLVREALVRRLPVPAPRADRAVVAFVGAAGCGRTTVAGRLAAAYAAGSDLQVCALALGTDAEVAELAELAGEAPVTGVPTAAAAGAIAAEAGSRALVVLDPGALRPRDEAAVRALRRDLRAAGATEVHLVLPATLSAPAARALVHAARPLRPAGIVLTHADEVPAGAVVELAVAEGLPITWQSTAGALGPADVSGLAQEILP